MSICIYPAVRVKVVCVVQKLNEKISLMSGQRRGTGPREGIALGTCEAGMLNRVRNGQHDLSSSAVNKCFSSTCW